MGPPFFSSYLKVYRDVGCGLRYAGASSVVSRVFMGLALFPDSQIRTTHRVRLHHSKSVSS